MTAAGNGGGIAALSLDTRVENSLFAENSTGFYGGGLWIYPYGAFWTIDQYIENDHLQMPNFYGAPTPAMTSKTATLNKMRDETLTKIVVGQLPLDEFDSFVESWFALGGQQITDEVNDWYQANK